MAIAKTNKFNFYTLGYRDKSIEFIDDHIHLEDNLFKGETVGFIGAEFLDIKRGVYRFITDEKGLKPFTIRTLDSPDKSISENVISVVPIKNNYIGVTIIKSDDKYVITTVEFTVYDKNTIGSTKLSRDEYTSKTLPLFYLEMDKNDVVKSNLTNSIISGVKKLELEETLNLLYTVDKYSYNPMRRITTRLFININGSLCTMKTDDGIMEISNNTPDKWKEKDVPYESGIYRVYYYTKHNTNYKFVRGVRLPYLTRKDVEGRLNIFSSMYENLVIFTTIHGEEILGAVMGNKYIILYEMNGSPHSIKLEPNEHKIIKSYTPV